MHPSAPSMSVLRRWPGRLGLEQLRRVRTPPPALLPAAPGRTIRDLSRSMASARFGAFFLLAASCCAQSAAAQPRKAAVFDLELVDTSQEAAAGERADQTARTALASAELRRLLAESGQLQVMDLAPFAAKIQVKSPLSKCNGCAEDLAREAGADIAVTGIVQKTSNLILSFAIEIKDVKSGMPIRGGQADIRGNTDETWLRGVRWIVKNRLLAEPLPRGP